MRVAVLTSVPEVAVAYGALAESHGHEVVVTIVPAMARAAFDDAPVAVVFAESRHDLAPFLRAHEPDVGLCTGFPWLVPQEAIDVPRLGIVNGHPTMLPKGRGPWPWAWAVRNGDTEIGMTYHFMDAAFDTGNVLVQAPVPFDAENETEATLIPKIEHVIGELIPQLFAKLEAGDPGTPQGDGDYQHRFEPEYEQIDTSRTRAEVHRQVRAWLFVPPRMRTGPLLDGRRVTGSSLVAVDGAERIECADGPLWLSL